MSEISQGYQGGVSRISKMQGEMKQKPSKTLVTQKNPGWSSLTLPSGLAISGTRSHLR